MKATTPAEPQDRPPLQELANRAATAGGGLHAVAFAVGVEDHRRMLADHAARVRDGHRAAMQAAGFAPPETSEDDEMGDITVTGDIHTHVLPPQQSAGPSSALKTGLALAAAALGGAGTTAGLMSALKPQPAVVAPATPQASQDADTKYELRISGGGTDGRDSPQ